MRTKTISISVPDISPIWDWLYRNGIERIVRFVRNIVMKFRSFRRLRFQKNHPHYWCFDKDGKQKEYGKIYNGHPYYGSYDYPYNIHIFPLSLEFQIMQQGNPYLKPTEELFIRLDKKMRKEEFSRWKYYHRYEEIVD